ncbi:thermonuclease family protein [Bosea eneae]|uniref:Thermonuclease family protein n=1 Tax=Bosea eneae TaxID=151454 RepID=A0ABW0IQ38_9HYPH
MGEVRHVGDGDSICVGRTSNIATWIEIRLADFDAPELHHCGGEQAKRALARLALSRPVTCIAERGRSGRVIVYDRVLARCRLQGSSLGDLMRQAGVREGGR